MPMYPRLSDMKKIFIGLSACFIALGYISFVGFFGHQNQKSSIDVYIKKVKNLENQIKELQNKYSLDTSFLNETESCKTIHIVIVCAGYNASREVTVLLKSILFYRRSPIHVHFISSSVAKSILSNLFRTWNLPHFTISFYEIDRLKPIVSWIPTNHYSGIYGLLKLVTLTVIPNSVNRVIVMDTDIIFRSDIKLLWDFFNNFISTQAIGLVENQSEWYLGKLFENYQPWPAMGLGFNTGVILMDCKKLRSLNWMEMWKNSAKINLKRMISTALADQDIINAVIKENPGIVYELPCYWNVQLSTFTHPEMCYKNQIYSAKVIHWNSRHKQNIEKQHSKYFKNMYEQFIEYDGSLLTMPLMNCGSHQVEDNFSPPVETDFCQDLLTKSLRLRRTHIYFLPYLYEPKLPFDVTLVLQLSIDRISALPNIASSWNGPISVALFVSDSDVRKLLHFVHYSKVLSERTNIGYHLVYKNYDESVYPINVLRNVALEHANTSFILSCDIDFTPSMGIYEYLSNSVLPMSSSKIAYIVPAFESYQYSNNLPKTKSDIITSWSNKSVLPFRLKEWPQGHNATNYTHWKSSEEIYETFWQEDFEPYVVLEKSLCPKYDRRFVGFGWNKVSYTYELKEAGFRFMVLPFAFIIHIPHLPSADITEFRTSVKYRQCLKSLKEDFINKIKKKYRA